MKPYLLILYLIALVVIGAAGDGLNNTGVQTWGHLFEAIEILAALLLVFLTVVGRWEKVDTWREFLLLLGAYICIRVAGFDYIYNLVAGNDWDYVCVGEGCNWWDQLLSNWNPGGLAFSRSIFLITGISFPIKYL